MNRNINFSQDKGSACFKPVFLKPYIIPDHFNASRNLTIDSKIFVMRITVFIGAWQETPNNRITP